MLRAAFCAAGLALVLVAADVPAQSNPAGSAAPAILGAMHEMSRTEMRMGMVGRSRGTTPEIRRFGELLYRDHRMADEMIVRLSGHYGFAYTPPSPTDLVDDDADILREVRSSGGRDLDRRFLAATIDIEGRVANALRAAQPHLSQKDLRDLTDTLLPIFEQHVTIAKQLEKKTK